VGHETKARACGAQMRNCSVLAASAVRVISSTASAEFRRAARVADRGDFQVQISTNSAFVYQPRRLAAGPTSLTIRSSDG
jgi:hypothetical protein